MSLIGKPCPKIGGLVFIKGDAVEVPSVGHPMVVEFWASWCGPCRMAFPHLSQLARKYKDKGLVVIGLNIEGDVNTAKRTVAQQGNNMDYLVAMDTAQQGSLKLMSAANISGIPCAFVIDSQGIIKYHGHPMEPKFAQVVDEVCKAAASGAAAAAPTRPKVTQSREDLLQMPVKELKHILNAWQVSFADLNEKTELVDRILERCKS